MSKKEQIEKIIGVEWELFDRVQNEGGRASCQDDEKTFFIMRRSQFNPWTEEMLSSYADDLQEAMDKGRNPLAEKYAWMMESTAPEKFAELKNQLPMINPMALEYIDQIAPMQVKWMKEYKEKYPNLASGNRPIETSEDTPWATSFETYLRGELHTYSVGTLSKYYKFMKKLEAAGRNLAIMTMNEEVKQYGYTDIDDAEKRVR